MTLSLIAILILSFLLIGYSADRIGIPDYGSDIPFSWLWTPVYFVSLVAFVVSALWLIGRTFS